MFFVGESRIFLKAQRDGLYSPAHNETLDSQSPSLPDSPSLHFRQDGGQKSHLCLNKGVSRSQSITPGQQGSFLINLLFDQISLLFCVVKMRQLHQR